MKKIFLLIVNLIFVVAILLILSTATPLGEYVINFFGYSEEKELLAMLTVVSIISGVITKLGEE